jgi:hypothetical protein
MRTSFYLLPIFFFVLSMSPNMSGDRIGLVLVSVYFLLVPGANYLNERLRKLRSSNIKFTYSIKDFIAAIILFGAFYIGWGISWEYCLVQLIYVILIVLKEAKEEVQKVGVSLFLSSAVYGLIFYCLIFIGLNQYSFSILFNTTNIVPALLVGIIIITTFYINEIVLISDAEANSTNKLTRVLLYLFSQVLAFSIYLYVVTELMYSAYFALALAIPFLLIVWDKTKINKNSTENIYRSLATVLWLLPISQTLFFLYYFLERTQVLQAIKGGY